MDFAKNLIIYCCLVLPGVSCASTLVNVKLNVVDENRQPVADADVVMSFLLSQGRNMSKGKTDASGFLEATNEGVFGVSMSVLKQGFYRTGFRTGYGDQKLTLLLREKKNPIALYAKKVTLELPERGQDYGFDFFKGDFVMSGHKGSQADVRIRFDRDLVDSNNFTQTANLSFVIPSDGLIEMTTQKNWEVSEFETPYLAVSEGYQNNIELTYKRSPGSTSRGNVNTPFFVRLRSQIDSEGNIETAHYCKIFPGIELMGALADHPLLRMTYYCNPTPNDRNLEFDPKQNLLKNLKPGEQVRQP